MTEWGPTAFVLGLAACAALDWWRGRAYRRWQRERATELRARARGWKTAMCNECTAEWPRLWLVEWDGNAWMSRRNLNDRIGCAAREVAPGTMATNPHDVLVIAVTEDAAIDAACEFEQGCHQQDRIVWMDVPMIVIDTRE